MSDTQPQSESPTTESPAQKQARLRRERRDAKIKAGGSARLEKITSLSGRPVEPAPAPPSERPHTTSTPDPEEVDITNHPYTSSRPATDNPNGPTEAEIRQLLRSGASPPDPQSDPFAPQAPGPTGAGPGEEDPMLRMLQQVMGGLPGGGGVGGGPNSPQPGGGDAGLPPGLAAMLGAGGGEGGGNAAHENPYGYMWRIVHVVFAFGLGFYIIATAPSFTGSRLLRSAAYEADEHVEMRSFFWVFATAELVLQSTRFFVERGSAVESGGVLGMVQGFLPEPWRGYVGLVRRYGGIWTRVVEDALVVVFVLGVVAWWRGESA